MARFAPMRFWSLDDLRAHAAEAALIDPSEDTLQMLRQAGFQTRTVTSDGPTIVYPVKSP
jgi:hypothetical protein